MKNHKHLVRTDRYEIRLLLDRGYSHREIAKALEKHHDSIDQEIRLNSVKGSYDPQKADLKVRQRRRMSRYQGMKLKANQSLEAYVREKLEQDWSPEEISGRLKYQESQRGYVSFFAIYRYLETVWGESLKKYLRYQGRPYGKHARTKPIDNRLMIDQRPKIIENRRVFGHWEGDFIVAGKKGSGALLVLVERMTRYVLIFRLENRKAATINLALGKLIQAKLLVKSLTLDNDICFRQHQEMSSIIGCLIFFCHPYHSWEKGSVENMNKWIRQYIPKTTDISRLRDGLIRETQNRLNSRPRKCLLFQTPAEVLEQHQKLKQTVERMVLLSKNKVAEFGG